MQRQTLLLASLLLAAPLALAQPAGAIDAVVTLSPDAEPEVDAPAGLIRLEESTPGERYVWNLTLERNYTTFEFRVVGFDLERPRQLVPSLVLAADRYPLFHQFPNERIWDVEGSGNVFHVNGSSDDFVLRLGVAGPANRTLVLEKDTTPPAFELGEIQQLTTIGFYQETTTEELALADLQIRRVGSEEWIRNPTPEYHVLQRFPVQGLDPETEYEARVVFTDWAGNEVTSETYTVTTPPRPELPQPVVTILSPEPNATLPPGAIVVRARIESPESEVPRDGVRMFFDKREVTERIAFQGDEVIYTPTTTLAPGKHSVAVEARNAAGGEGVARWTFEIGDATGTNDTPMPAAMVVAALAVALVLRAGRRPR